VTASSFRNQNWPSRLGTMGDIAENVFEEVHPFGWSRFGLNRPPFSVAKLSMKMRYAPDYLTTASLIEVQGHGADQKTKLKVEKQRALYLWQQDYPVQLFLWDNHHKAYGLVTLDQMTHDIDAHGRLNHFPEGKPYWEIDAADLEMEWTPWARPDAKS